MGVCVGVLDRKAEGEVVQGVGWLGSATERRQYLQCGRRTEQVARPSGISKESRNRVREGNEGRKRGNWYIMRGYKAICVLNRVENNDILPTRTVGTHINILALYV